MKKQIINILLLTMLFFIIQQLSMLYLVVIIFLLGVCQYKQRNRYIGFVISLVIGFIGWKLTYQVLEKININLNYFTIFQRVGLLWYIVSFYLLERKFPTKLKIKLVGENRDIQMPFFFKGNKNESVKGFVWIYISIFIILIFMTLYFIKPTLNLLAFGILFSFINSILEELIWRKYILQQLNTLFSFQNILISNALLFGIYHVSLGFPLYVCFLYAIGGYFMSGIACFSKGILGSILMHFIVNIFFVILGIVPFY